MAKIEHKPSQNERILTYMRDFGSITQIEALQDLGVLRLASRICDLRRRGHAIIGTVENVKNRYGEKCRIKRYRLQEEGAKSD